METDWKKRYEDAMARMELCERTGLEKKSDYIFPELRESDDERIINQLITLVNSTGEILLIPTNKEELITWLNKCKESLHVSKTCKENADPFTDEDERARGALVEYFGPKVQLDFVRGVPIQKIRDWLEKQKEQKPAEWSTEDEIYLQDALWCIKQASKVARGENDMGACWSAERWLKSLKNRGDSPKSNTNSPIKEGQR